ncbi:M48 family metallopeptidase [Bacillus sp. AFS017336]|uniref:M48 family metallopeptidase n=1 Tax=Bacillus sp. AFS017336 TaxID=2033489 RepID=UPI000BEF6CE4|nr:SprT family zinc-dependent metalloprotease [Bacillus sp. AFS017336]PEL11953.1 zinc protease [Bacillus sp. AFS017336]
MIHTYLGETISFNVLYKKRKSIGIYIDSYGNVEVQAPKDTPDKNVIEVLEINWELILQKSNEMKERLRGPKERTYEFGETFLYLGSSYLIQISHDESIQQDQVVLKKDCLNIIVKQLDDERIQQALKRFYYQQCKAIVEKSIKKYQSNFKVKPSSIRITDSKTNWGTCDSKRQLTFNWKLAMAPQQVIDYVVVHEMCHLIHMNHDRSFWRLVGKIIPDYKERENWLALSSWKMTV